jgi:hypothetical protein
MFMHSSRGSGEDKEWTNARAERKVSLQSDAANSHSSGSRQVVVEFPCEGVDIDEVSDAVLELPSLAAAEEGAEGAATGVLSVSVERLGPERDLSAAAAASQDASQWEALVQSTAAWERAKLTATVAAGFNCTQLLQHLHLRFPAAQFDLTDLAPGGADDASASADYDWVLHVQRSWPPQVIGDLLVQFPWHLSGPHHQVLPTVNNRTSSASSMSLVLEGGAAFGTGDHATTRLCCLWLQRHLPPLVKEMMCDTESASSPHSLSVLDYGCGSAILALGKCDLSRSVDVSFVLTCATSPCAPCSGQAHRLCTARGGWQRDRAGGAGGGGGGRRRGLRRAAERRQQLRAERTGGGARPRARGRERRRRA